MPYKLVVSDTLEYEVKFTLRDGSKDREFGFKATSQRVDIPAFRDSLANSTRPLVNELRDYIQGPLAKMQMVDWIKDAALQDEAGKPAPAGAEALSALLLNEGLTQHVFNVMADANSAKGKLGN